MNTELSQIKLVLRKSEYSIYPVIEEFLHPEKKISSTSVQSIFDGLTELEEKLGTITGISRYTQYIDTLRNMKLWITRVILLAQKRDKMDAQKRLLRILNSLKEFSFFTSAVNLGVIVYLLGFDVGFNLLLLGIAGIILYFIVDIFRLFSTIRRDNNDLLGKADAENLNDLEEMIVKLEGIDEQKSKHLLSKLENLIISADETKILNYKQIIQLKHIYFHSIKGDMMLEIRESDASPLVKQCYEQLNRYLENIIQIFVISLVAVDINRPIPKYRTIFEKVFKLESIIKYLGYIMLNAISYNLLFTVLRDTPGVAFIANLVILISFALIINMFEKYMHNSFNPKPTLS